METFEQFSHLSESIIDLDSSDDNSSDDNTFVSVNDEEKKSNMAEEEISTVSIKIPPFWAEYPELWFAQVEAQFAIAKITADLTKFHTVVGKIDSHVLAQVSDAVLKPPATDKYANFKKCLIEVYGDSEHRKMKKLLSMTDIGDRKPSQLLNELSTLGGDKLSNELLKTIWLERLPQQVRAILSTSTVGLKELAPLADRIMDTGGFSGSVNQVVSSSTPNQVDELGKQIAVLTKKVEQLSFQKNNQRGRSRSRSRNRSTNASNNSELCWYHRCYGEKATKCREPCVKNSKKSKN